MQKTWQQLDIELEIWQKYMAKIHKTNKTNQKKLDVIILNNKTNR